MPSTLSMGRVRGATVDVHASLPLGALVVFLGGGVGIDRAHELGLDPSLMRLGPTSLGLMLALAFVLCVVLHELAHVAVALALGARPSRVTFTVVGGASRFEGLPPDTWSRGLVEAAGPAASVVLGLLGVAAFRFLSPERADLRLLAFELAQLNLVLAVLNLLPAAPLDGGRVLQTLLGGRLGNERAQRVAVLAGRALAGLLVVAGLVSGAPVPLLVAVFVLFAATAEPSEPVRRPPVGLRVGDVMVPPPRPIAPEASLDALERRLRDEHLAGLLVVDGDRLVGAVGLSRLAEVLPGIRAQTRVAEVMARALPSIGPGMLLEAALAHMERLHVELLPVFSAGELVGVVKREAPRVDAAITAHPAPSRSAIPAPSVQPAERT